MAELKFYLAHYYDKEKKQYVPIMYVNLARNVMLDVESEESVYDAMTQLQDARVYTSSELFAHIGNTEIHTPAERIDNIFTALNELVLHASDKVIHVTAENKAYWNDGAVKADEAAAGVAQANERIDQLESDISRIEDSLYSNITSNPFSITFDSLTGLSLVKGIWNAEKIRVEC